MRNKMGFLKTVAMVVVVSFLWSDLVWAGGLEAQMLAAQPQVAAVAKVAVPAMEAAAIVKTLAQEGIKSMADLARLGIERGHIGDNLCLISPANNKKDENIYYVFGRKGKLYRRFAISADARSAIDELFELLDAEKLSKVGDAIPVTIADESYLETQYIIAESQKPAIDSFLKILYGEENTIEAVPPAPAVDARETKPDKGLGQRGFSHVRFVNVMVLVCLILALFAIPNWDLVTNMVSIATLILLVLPYVFSVNWKGKGKKGAEGQAEQFNKTQLLRDRGLDIVGYVQPTRLREKGVMIQSEILGEKIDTMNGRTSWVARTTNSNALFTDNPNALLPILLYDRQDAVNAAISRLGELGYGLGRFSMYAGAKDGSEDLTDYKTVRVSEFNEAGIKTGEKTMWFGKKKPQAGTASPYTRPIKKGEEKPIASISLSHEGKLGEIRVEDGADLTKLAGILGVSVAQVSEEVQKVIQEEITLIKENKEYGIGIFGAASEVVLVDNLGGLDSGHEGLKGTNAELRNGKLYVDIDALRKIANNKRLVFKDVFKHELWHSTLEIVEQNEAIQEVTAIYESLKSFMALSPEDQEALIAFLSLSKEENGLDSKEYAKFLQYVKDKGAKGDALIVLAISYVAGTERYAGLHGQLKSVLAEDVATADRKLQLAIDIYTDLINAVTGVEEKIGQGVTELAPAIQKTKIAELKSKAGMKVRMVVGKANIQGAQLVTDLVSKGKYIKLYAEDLEQNPYIVDWLKKVLEGKDKSPFVIYSKENKQETVTEFLRKHGIKQGELPQDIAVKDVIDARDLGFALENGLGTGSLSLPFIYSISGIYLAGQVVLNDGNLDQLKDKDILSYNSLMAMYSSWFGDTFTVDMLKEIIKGTWPKMLSLVEDLKILRMAIVNIETAA